MNKITRPLVSVCMPCYNVERYVAAAIDCVLAQTLRPVEIIAVNDGSTDGTGEILDSYRDRGVRVIEQDNAGAAVTRNRGYAASSGEYVLFLDADDLIGPNHLQALAGALPEGTRHIAMAQWDRFTIDPSEAHFPLRSTYRDLAGPEWLTLDWVDGGAMTQSGMFLIPRSLLQAAGCWDERLSLIDDFEFFARIIAGSEGIRFAREARLYYRSSISGSLSGSKSREAAESAYLSLLLGTSHLLAVENTPRTRRAAANMLQTFIYDFYPRFADLRSRISRRIAELGGTDLAPLGPPGFHKLRRWTGWRVARRIQLLSERWGLNQASRQRHSERPSQ